MVPVLKGAGRLIAMVLGRWGRVWWSRLSQEERDAFAKRVARYRYVFYVFGGTVGSGAFLFYMLHLEETPITKRMRLMILNEAQVEHIVKEERDSYISTFKDALVPPSSPAYVHVKEVIQCLLATRVTEDMERIHWKLYLVHSDMFNAFVFPSGEIFVFTGLVSGMKSRDELAIILAHEISHALLKHGAEGLSHHGVTEVISLAVISAVWALTQSAYLAMLIQQMHNSLMTILFHLPYSRKLEMEADEVGMMIAAKACFDPRAGPALWNRLHKLQSEEESNGVEYLSTHPAHKTRKNYLEALLPSAHAVSHASQCEQLAPEAAQFKKRFRLI